MGVTADFRISAHQPLFLEIEFLYYITSFFANMAVSTRVNGAITAQCDCTCLTHHNLHVGK